MKDKGYNVQEIPIAAELSLNASFKYWENLSVGRES
jgi:hypothetical protein